MLNLYIDTNAYLSFFHLTSDDLEELKKLELLIETTREIQLHLPEQTYDEFNRNRDTKIADALKKFKEEKLNNQFPQMSKEYPEYNKMREAMKEFDQNKSKLLEKLNDDISNKNLAADKIVTNLFHNALFHDTTDELLQIAKTRFDLGKPPGKNKSYGDALNWETLLNKCNKGEDIYFISDDKDYFSELNTQLFNGYLKDEWNTKKKSDIYFFKRISEFFKEKFPQIVIASEYEKDLLIKDLSGSRSFAATRYLLTRLSKFTEFSTDQLNAFTVACINNNQILWIRDDADIKEFIFDIVKPNHSKIDADLFEQFDKIYDPFPF